MRMRKHAHEIEPAEIVASIGDLVGEILLRLPIKSLLRFKLVSKLWLSLIEDPIFYRRRYHRPKQGLGLFFHHYHGRYNYVSFASDEPKNGPSLNLDFSVNPSGTRILDSCNGLLLCCSVVSNPPMRTFDVYNPTTNQFSEILKLKGEDGYNEFTLAFDPAKSPYNYNVVRVANLCLADSPTHNPLIMVYSSESGTWTVATEVNMKIYLSRGVYWNGSIHWIYDRTVGKFLRFDIHQKMYMEMPKAPVQIDSRGSYCFLRHHLIQSCDHLHYIRVNFLIIFDVYEMKRDYSEWFVKYHVDLSFFADAYPSPPYSSPEWYRYTIFSLVRDEEEENPFLVLNIPGEAIKYNLVAKTFNHIYKFEDRSQSVNILGFQYIECLLSVG